MVRENIQHQPDKIKELDNFMATNPYAQPDELQRVINRLVPGSYEHAAGDESDAINAATQKFKPKSFSGGGLVQGLHGGGLIQKFNQGGIVDKLPQVRAAKWLGNKAKGAFNFAKDKIAQVSDAQKPRVDHIHPPQTDDGGSKAAAAQVAQSSGDAATVSGDPAPGIPNFDAGMMRSQSKIRTLGVSV
jgi:hypothetical protein